MPGERPGLPTPLAFVWSQLVALCTFQLQLLQVALNGIGGLPWFISSQLPTAALHVLASILWCIDAAPGAASPLTQGLYTLLLRAVAAVLSLLEFAARLPNWCALQCLRLLATALRVLERVSNAVVHVLSAVAPTSLHVLAAAVRLLTFCSDGTWAALGALGSGTSHLALVVLAKALTAIDAAPQSLSTGAQSSATTLRRIVADPKHPLRKALVPLAALAALAVLYVVVAQPLLAPVPTPAASTFVGAHYSYAQGTHSAASVTRLSQLTHTANDIILERLSFSFQKWSAAPLLFKIASVLLSAAPIVIVFGSAYRFVTGSSWSTAFMKIYFIINRLPGSNMSNEKSALAFILINLAFFVGLFSFAVFLSLVSDEVKGSIRSIRNGRYALRFEDHVLVLNWNQHVIPMLRQFAYGRKYSDDPFFRRPIVILSDRQKTDMDSAIADRLKGMGGFLEVYTRSGQPMLPRDLSTVAASKASTIIVLHPESAKSVVAAEAAKAATAMALASTGGQAKRNVIFQSPTEVPSGADYVGVFGKTSRCLQQSSHVGTLRIPDHSFMDRFTSHTAVQPGIFRVWMKILQQGHASAGLRIQDLPEALRGKMYVEVRHAYPQAIVCGYLRPAAASGGALGTTTNVNIDPAENQVLREGDKLVLLSRTVDPQPSLLDSEARATFQSAMAAATERLRRASPYNASPKKIIIAGWSQNITSLQDLMLAFADSSPANSSITIVLPHPPEVGGSNWVGKCKFNFQQSDYPTSLKALTDAGIRTADAVVVGQSQEGAGDLEEDAITMAGLLQIQDAVTASGRTDAPHVVARLHRLSNLNVAAKYFRMLLENADRMDEEEVAAAAAAGTRAPPRKADHIVRNPEIFLTDDIISSLLAQVAAQPDYTLLIRELLGRRDGVELYLRNPAAFNIAMGESVTIAEVVETARQLRHTAVGYVKADGSCFLVPDPGHVCTFEKGDQIIAFAEDFKIDKPVPPVLLPQAVAAEVRAAAAAALVAAEAASTAHIVGVIQIGATSEADAVKPPGL